MRIVLTAILCGVCGLAGGCGEADDETSGDGYVSLSNGCDITEARCQRAIFEATDDARGNADARMPEVRTITVQEFARWLDSGGESSGEPDVWSNALPVLHLLAQDSSVAEESNEEAVAGVAAYYDPETKQVSVIDRGASDPREDLFVLAHEFVHALQDAEFDLSALLDARATSFDSMVATKALIEGEATMLGLAVLGRARAQSPESIDWNGFTRSLRAAFFEAVSSSDSPLLAAALTAPYPLGTEQLVPLWLKGRQSAVDAVYQTPHLSVLDWVEDTVVTKASRLEALDCFPTAGPPGFTAYGSDSLGPLGPFAVALQGDRTIEEAWALSLGVRGDRVVAFTEASVPGSYAIAWRIRFDSAAAATIFETDLTGGLSPGSAVKRLDREVIYYGTTRPDRLALWTDPTYCGAESELPMPREQSDTAEAVRRRKYLLSKSRTGTLLSR